MKVKTTMRQMKNAKVSFISLVTCGANRIPFRILKSDSGENSMLDLSKMRHVLKGEAAPAKSLGFAAILRGSKPAQTVAKTPPPLQSIAKAAPMQSIAKPAQPQQQQRQTEREQVAEERQRQGLAPNQPLHSTPATAPAPRRAGNVPKQPAKPSRDVVTLAELRAQVDSALAAQRQKEQRDEWNERRSAFSQISPTQPHHTAGGGGGSAWDLRNRGGQLAVQLLAGTDKPLPTNTAFRSFSAAGAKA